MYRYTKLSKLMFYFAGILLIISVFLEFKVPKALFEGMVKYIPCISGHRVFCINIVIGMFCSVVVVYLSALFDYDYEKRKLNRELDIKIHVIKDFLEKVLKVQSIQEYLKLFDSYKAEIQPFYFGSRFYPKENDKDKENMLRKISMIEPEIYYDFFMPEMIEDLSRKESGISDSLLYLYKQLLETSNDATIRGMIQKEEKHIEKMKDRRLEELKGKAAKKIRQFENIYKMD